jgi:signal transduction histidine kinase
MDGKQGIDFGTVLIFGTLGMIILAMGIIVFVFIYQKKIVDKQNELSRQALEYQKLLMDAVIQTKELEQRRIALELHDDVGSTLTAIKFFVTKLTVTPEEKELLHTNLSSAIQKVRRISNDLLPSVLEELGLRTAIQSLLKTLNETTGVVFSSGDSGGEYANHSKDVELTFYRVLQELLNNILKYAEASHVQVMLLSDPDSLEMIVQDDGKGFEPSDHTEHERPSLGLRNMESRIQQIKGALHFEKRSTAGTKVTVLWKK